MVPNDAKNDFDRATEKALRERFKTAWGIKAAKDAYKRRDDNQKKVDERLAARINDDRPEPKLKPKPDSSMSGATDPMTPQERNKAAERHQATFEHQEETRANQTDLKKQLDLIENWETPIRDEARREELRQEVKQDFGDAADITLAPKFNIAVKLKP